MFIERHQSRCTCCWKMVSGESIHIIYANRPSFCICKLCNNCPEPSFRCGRCEECILNNEQTFFCEMCGEVLCYECLEQSLEMGEIKCSMCLEHPIKVNINSWITPSKLSFNNDNKNLKGIVTNKERDIHTYKQENGNSLNDNIIRYIATPVNIKAFYTNKFHTQKTCELEQHANEKPQITLQTNKGVEFNKKEAIIGNSNNCKNFSLNVINENDVWRKRIVNDKSLLSNIFSSSPNLTNKKLDLETEQSQEATSSLANYSNESKMTGYTQATSSQAAPIFNLEECEMQKPSMLGTNVCAEDNTIPNNSVNTIINVFTSQSKYRTLFDKKELGKGAQGVVYKCHTIDNEVVVSKEMEFDSCNRSLFIIQLRQAERMRKLNHPHLIRYLDVVTYNNPLKINIIMPYYKDGDLKEFIAKQKELLSELQACSIILQITEALKYLHSQEPPLIHRDVKPENILLLNEEQVLLMDLDLCTSAEMIASITKRRVVNTTEEYRAPELINGMGSTKSDIFSLGVVSFVLAVMPEFPFVTNDKGEQLIFSEKHWTEQSLERATRRAFYTRCRYQFSEEFISLVCQMLSPSPSQRPSASDVINSITRLMEVALLKNVNDK